MVVSLFSAAVTVAGIDRVSADEREDAIVITASAWKFNAPALAVASGRPAKLLVENNDAVVHTFTVEALALDVRLGPFDHTLVPLEAPPGRYEFRCRVTGHEAMRGILTVE